MLKRGLKRFVDIHPQVQDALVTGKPLVALETTVLTHGLPYPTNLELYSSLESTVTSAGAIPATIGILGGRIKIGMDKYQVEQLIDHATKEPVKISRRDIAPAIVSKANGGTTCSATLIFAALAGIKVFATGGLGGVHRGGELSMDVSADLFELSRCPVGLVSSGIKSILDIGRTLEYLETLGVPVMTYGNSKDFPAFFSRQSGFKSPWNVDNPADAALLLHTQTQLELNNGILFAAPIPGEYAADGAATQAAIDQAVMESHSRVRGSDVTPWILSRVSKLTDGQSTASNIALLNNNARIGGQIAAALSSLSAFDQPYQDQANVPPYSLSMTQQVQAFSPSQPENTLAKLVVIGCSALDITAQSTSDEMPESTVPGTVTLTPGGVGRNITEAAHRLLPRSFSPLLISPVGRDVFGAVLRQDCESIGLRTDGLFPSDSGKATAVCNLTIDPMGSLINGVADMPIISETKVSAFVDRLAVQNPEIVAIDANLHIEVITMLVAHCRGRGIPVFFEPTSVAKATAIIPAIIDQTVHDQFTSSNLLTSPNLLELERLYLSVVQENRLTSTMDSFALKQQFRDDIERLALLPVKENDSSCGTLQFLLKDGISQMALGLIPFFLHLIIKCGSRGVVVVSRIQQGHKWDNNPSLRQVVGLGRDGQRLVVQHFPPPEVSQIINDTGAGDTFVGAVLAGLVIDPLALNDPVSSKLLIDRAQKAAAATLASPYSVSRELANPQSNPQDKTGGTGTFWFDFIGVDRL